MKEIDEDAARELYWFIINDGNLYRQRITPIVENMKRKVSKGTYDENLAVKAFQYAADDGAKRYSKEVGEMSFNVPTRKETAKQLLEYYTEAIFEKDDIEYGTRNRPFPLNIK